MAEILINDSGVDIKVRVDKDKKVVIFDDGERAISIAVNDLVLINNLVTITMLENLNLKVMHNTLPPNM